MKKNLLVVFIALCLSLSFAQTKVTWFIGLGAGTQPEQLEGQEAFVNKFNASQSDIELELLIIDNNVARDTLATLIASGNSPDIVGPVGIAGAHAFNESYLDLAPLVEKAGADLSIWPEAAVDFYRNDGKLVGLPFAVFPTMIWYNQDLFDEAGLAYPPEEYGATYADGEPWDIAKLRELGMKLTVDANGYDATEAEFDPENIVQFGFNAQWAGDIRAEAVLFGADSMVNADGNAVISDNWRNAIQWYFDGMHTDHFIPNNTYNNSDLLANGNGFSVNRVAMNWVQLWYQCCIGDVNWGAAVPPVAPNGTQPSKLHADTFRILEGSQNPDAAFTVLWYMLTEGAPDLLQVYGAFPSIAEQTPGFIAGLDQKFPQAVNWDVALAGLDHPDNPSHEGYMPSYNQAFSRLQAFQNLYKTDANIDVQAELDVLQAELQLIFDSAR